MWELEVCYKFGEKDKYYISWTEITFCFVFIAIFSTVIKMSTDSIVTGSSDNSDFPYMACKERV